MKIQSYELFYVQTDTSIDYTIEKVVLNEKETREFILQYNGLESVEIIGFYGNLDEVQKSLQKQLGVESLQNCSYKDSKICGIKIENKAILCLILPNNFFLDKPIDQQTIKLTLFRIFSDLTNHIQLCLREEIFDKWYGGMEIPFSNTQLLQISNYSVLSYQDVAKQEILDYEVKFACNQNLISMPIFLNNSSQCIYGQVSSYTSEEVKQLFKEQIYNFLLEIYALSNNKMDDNLIENLIKDKIGQNSEIQQYLYYSDLQKTISNIFLSIRKELQKFNQNSNQNSDQDELTYFQTKFDKEFEKHFNYNYSLKIFNGRINLSLQTSNFSILKQQQSDQMEIKLYSSQNCKLPMINITTRSKYQLNFIVNFSNLPKFAFSFIAQNNSIVVIVVYEVQQESTLYSISAGSKIATFLTTFYKTKNPKFYFDKGSNSLYIFNVGDKEIKKITLTGNSKTIDQTYYQQFNNGQFIVDQIAYLSLTKQFVLLLQNKTLLRADDEFKTVTNLQLLDNNGQKIDETQFTNLFSCPSGKYFYLQDQEACYLFDCNNTLLKIIKVTGTLRIFSNQNDVLILSIKQMHQNITQCFFHKAIILENLNSTDQIKQIEQQKIDLIGNPAIDIVKGSLSKFGLIQKTVFESSLECKQFYLDSDENKLKQISNYLQLQQIDVFKVQQFQHLNFHIEKVERLKHYILSRVPIQLCTIENECLIPLINGFRITDKIEQRNIKIEEKAEQIKFGHLEKSLGSIKENIYVIGIIGKQSSGKSYLLNRIFGTRYSVAACRCTNGIWASFANLDGQNFLIFDCEGLFSSARSSREEQLMLAFIIAISDVTILNQDLNFSRCLTDLMNNLQEIQNKLKGDQLFKGYLYTILRDISNNDNQGVEQEFQQSLMNQRQGKVQSFLKCLFNNEFKVFKLTNFESKFFDLQINELRKQFVFESKKANHWRNGQFLISIMKIILSQLELVDFSDSSILLQQVEIKKIINNSKFQWFKFLQEYANLNEFQLPDHQNSIENFNDEIFAQLQQQTISNLNQQIREKFIIDLKLSIAEQKHNQNLSQIRNKFEEVLEFQKQQIKSKAFDQLNQIVISEENKLFKQKQVEVLEVFLQNQVNSLTFCSNKCQFCFLDCSQFKFHFFNKEKKIEEINCQIQQLDQEQQELGKIENEKKLFELQINLDQREKELQALQNLIQQYQLTNQKLENLTLEFPQEIQIELKNQFRDIDKLSEKDWKVVQERIVLMKSELENQLQQSQITSNCDEFEQHKQSKINDAQLRIKEFTQMLNQQEKELVDKIIDEREQNRDLDEMEFYQNKLKIQIKQSNKSPNNNSKQNKKKIQISQLKEAEFLDQLQKLFDEQDKLEKELKLLRRKLSKLQDQAKLETENKIKSLEAIQNDFYFLDELKENDKAEDQKEYQVYETEIIEKANLKQKELDKQHKLINSQIKIIDIIISLLHYERELQNLEAEHYKKEDMQQETGNNKIQDQLKKLTRSIDSIPEIIEIQNYTKTLFQQIQKEGELIQTAKVEQEIDLSNWFNALIQKFQIEKQDLLQKQQKYIRFTELNSLIQNLKENIQNIQKSNVDHSCQRNSHICERKCFQCQDTKCSFQAGHSGEHLCKTRNHLCNELCSINGCNQKCTQNLNHQTSHICNTLHKCNEKCKFCENQCQIDNVQEHNQHQCYENRCVQKCFLCQSQCKEGHNHSLKPKQEHLCELQNHICQEKCEEPGICTIDYSQSLKEFESNFHRQKYEYVEYTQKSIKESCSLTIKNGQLKHTGKHICKLHTQKQFHYCGQKCPDCNVLCTKSYGHQGKHYAESHRNKDQQRYTSTGDDIQTIEVGQAKKVMIGDSASLETCQQSCERQGKSHFHLVWCLGEDSCLEKRNHSRFRVRHAANKYAGYQHIDFDEVACQDYWMMKNWEHPIQNAQILNEINNCNYYCAFCFDEKNIQNFCTALAWHTQETNFASHQFPCKQKHQNENYSGINICFVIDSTSSMQDYFDQTIEAINQIVNNSKNSKTFSRYYIPVQFAVVSYKDHSKNYTEQKFLGLQWRKEVIVTQQDFHTDPQRSIKFLEELKAEGGDDCPEAVLDGLNASLNLKWQEKYYKIIYLIADSPPHGTSGKNGSKIYHHFEDNFPDGCPCGLEQTSILQTMKKKNINLKILKLNNQLDLMISEFEKDYSDEKNKRKIQAFMIQNINEYATKIGDDFCRVVQNLDITFKK